MKVLENTFLASRVTQMRRMIPKEIAQPAEFRFDSLAAALQKDRSRNIVNG